MTKNQLEYINSEGEGLTVEYKKAQNQLPENLFETVCAFLNRNGGTILLGVSDSGKFIGVEKKLAVELSRQIANLSNNPQILFPSFLIARLKLDVNLISTRSDIILW